MSRRKWQKKHNGLTLRSGLEQKVAKFLDSESVEYGYESEKLLYTVPESNHSYTPDFILPSTIVIEVKGRLTAADRKKMLLVRDQNPDRDIRFLFAIDNKISKASKTTYSSWCEKKGFKYHVDRDGKVPAEWLAEKKPKAKTKRKTA